MKWIRAGLQSPIKVVYVVLGVLFLMLGLVGLVIPVIPGILFLFAALFVLGKASHRVRRWSEGNDAYRAMSIRIERMSRVTVIDRVKVACLMMVGATVRTIDMAVTGVSSLVRGGAAVKERTSV